MESAVRILPALFLLATAVATAAPMRDEAPADVYFGPFKYSAISVRTKIDFLGRAYRERWQDDASLVHDAQMVQTAYEEWARRYPKDPWLAPTAFHLAQLYFEIQSDDARRLAKQMFEYVAKTFPNTKQGHLSRLRLQQGFPPLHAESPVSPTPNPYSSPTPTPAGTPSPATAASSPVPSSAGTAAPSPKAST